MNLVFLNQKEMQWCKCQLKGNGHCYYNKKEENIFKFISFIFIFYLYFIFIFKI